MKDFINQELSIGDRVVRGVSGRGGGFSGPYYVVGFTPQMVHVARSLDAKYRQITHPGNLVRVSHA